MRTVRHSGPLGREGPLTRLLSVVLGIGSCTAILTTSGALAAYGSPRLEATQSGNAVTIDVAQSPGDDATAIVRIISPLGSEIAAAQAAGTAIGTASASFVTAAGADVVAEGRIEIVASAPVPPAQLTGCADGERVQGLWRLRLTGGGLALDVPIYLVVGGDLLFCIPHPSTLPQGAKLVGLKLTVSGPWRLRPAGTWISIWVPYGPTEADTSRAVASPAVFGEGTVSFVARARGAGAVLTGQVLQAGAPRDGARVRITGGSAPSAQRLLGTATTNRGGRFTFRAKSGTFFRGTASVGRSSPPGICFVLEPFLRPIPCVNPTLNGFSVRSRSVRKS